MTRPCSTFAVRECNWHAELFSCAVLNNRCQKAMFGGSHVAKAVNVSYGEKTYSQPWPDIIQAFIQDYGQCMHHSRTAPQDSARVKAGVGNTHTQHDPSFHRKKVLDFGNEKVAPDNGKGTEPGEKEIEAD